MVVGVVGRRAAINLLLLGVVVLVHHSNKIMLFAWDIMLQVNGTGDYILSFTNKAKARKNITKKKKMWLWGGERRWNKASLYIRVRA